MISKSNIAKLIAVTSQWNLRLWYTDYLKMLEEIDLDAVIISTSHYLHYTMVMNAIKMSKHVLVDKPILLEYGL
jgi:predicted dehydrogenase